MRRDELYGSSSEGDDDRSEHGVEDAEERARLNERLSSLLGLDLSAPELAPEQRPDAAETLEEQGAGDDEGNHEEEFEFRLFSTSANAAAPAKVVLSASDDEDNVKGDGAFVQPVRPESYYLAGEATPEQQERYRSAAVTAEDVVEAASRRAWGLERPWRVVKISLTSTRPKTGPKAVTGPTKAIDGAEDGAKRKRPGKKRRIATRIKAKAEKERQEVQRVKREEEEKLKISKAELLVEKKKRLNREKKLKRRAKEKEKKLAAGETLPASEVPDSPNS